MEEIIGLVPGPAHCALFRPVGGRTIPARATPARWRQVLIKPPVDLPGDGVTGYDMAVEGGYDVAIIDRMLPKMDGLTLVGALRNQRNETPVLILSALGQVDDRVKGLRAGGDDYLSKPYAFSELLARV